MSRVRSQEKESGPTIRPIAEAPGGVTLLQVIVSRTPVDDVVREIIAGRLPVYDAGGCLFAQEGRLGVLRDMNRPEVAE